MKYLYLVLGFIFLGLGIVGVYLPFLPTTPFILISVYFFGKSSDKYSNMVKNSRFYRENIGPIKEKKGLPLLKKIKILLIMTVLFSVAFFFMKNIIGRLVVLLVLLAHYYYFLFKVKNKD